MIFLNQLYTAILKNKYFNWNCWAYNEVAESTLATETGGAHGVTYQNPQSINHVNKWTPLHVISGPANNGQRSPSIPSSHGMGPAQLLVQISSLRFSVSLPYLPPKPLDSPFHGPDSSNATERDRLLTSLTASDTNFGAAPKFQN